MIIIECKNCGKEFGAFPVRIKEGKAKFCSKECSYSSKRKKLTKECFTCGKNFMIKPSREKHGFGKFCSPECFHSRPNRISGENHHLWKGDKIGYWGVHDWIIKIKGRPQACKHCGATTAKKYEWANLSGKYTRNVDDWIRLCTKCHIAFDKSMAVGEENGQSKMTEKQVLKIREIREKYGTPYSKLAKASRLSLMGIHGIITRKTWKHI